MHSSRTAFSSLQTQQGLGWLGDGANTTFSGAGADVAFPETALAVDVELDMMMVDGGVDVANSQRRARLNRRDL